MYFIDKACHCGIVRLYSCCPFAVCDTNTKIETTPLDPGPKSIFGSVFALFPQTGAARVQVPAIMGFEEDTLCGVDDTPCLAGDWWE